MHAEFLHFAHLLIYYGFTRVQMRCVTTVSTLTLTLHLDLNLVINTPLVLNIVYF